MKVCLLAYNFIFVYFIQNPTFLKVYFYDVIMYGFGNVKVVFADSGFAKFRMLRDSFIKKLVLKNEAVGCPYALVVSAPDKRASRYVAARQMVTSVLSYLKVAYI